MKRFLALSLVVLLLLTGCRDYAEQNQVTKDDTKDEQSVVEETEETDESVEEENDDQEEKVAVKEKEPSDTDIINSYYKKLEIGDLQGAFALKVPSKQTFTEFENWYKDVQKAEVGNFEKLADKQYRFKVTLNESQNKNSTYTVVMQVQENGLLKTLSAVRTWDDFIVKTFVKENDGEVKLYVQKNGKDILVTRFTTNAEDPLKNSKLTYKEIFFDKYLVYTFTGYEWAGLRIFDIDKDKEVFASNDGVDKFGFSKNGKFFYECAPSGMASGVVKIYNVPAFTLKRDLVPDQALIHTCYDFQTATNAYQYALSYDGFNNPQTFTYYFDTDEVK